MTRDKVTLRLSLSVEYAVDEEPGTSPRLLVRYEYGYGMTISERIAVEGEGLERTRAERWWRRRSAEPLPRTAAEAARVASEGALLEPIDAVLLGGQGAADLRLIGRVVFHRPRAGRQRAGQ